MNNNPILADLHATRRKLLEESGGTLAGLIARLQANQKASGRKILPTQPTNRCTGAVKAGGATGDSQSSPPGER